MEWHSGKSAVSFGKSLLWLFFCLGLAPFFCLVCCFLLTKRKSGWGICGSSWVLVLCFSDLLGFASFDGPPGSLYKCLSDCLCSCKDRASVRHRPNARKKMRDLRLALCFWFVF